jgi:hypothetical protein
MTTLVRRLDRIERQAEETMLRPMHERVHRIMQRLGGTLPEAQVEDIVVRYARAERWLTPWMQRRITELRAQRMSDREIRDIVIREIAEKGGVDSAELRAGPERIVVGR